MQFGLYVVVVLERTAMRMLLGRWHFEASIQGGWVGLAGLGFVGCWAWLVGSVGLCLYLYGEPSWVQTPLGWPQTLT